MDTPCCHKTSSNSPVAIRRDRCPSPLLATNMGDSAPSV